MMSYLLVCMAAMVGTWLGNWLYRVVKRARTLAMIEKSTREYDSRRIDYLYDRVTLLESARAKRT